ncbi:hypothetical protein HXA35_04765 [Bacillus sp. A301a_S52]|nr:hypothetical protein [Bacillus sp. A301a_S52]
MNELDMLDHFRPVFVFLLMVSIVVLLTIIFQKKSHVNGYGIAVFSISSLFIAMHLLFTIAVLTDELNLDGDDIMTYLCIAVVLINVINPILYLIYNHKTNL